MLASEESSWDEIDSLFSGRPPAYRFANQGDQALGVVVRAYTQQARQFGTNEPKTFDDGTPIREPVIELRDTPTGELRSLYVSSWRMRNAIQQALTSAGCRGPRTGGTLLVRYCADEPGKNGAQAAKVYEAAYDPSADQAQKINLGPSARLGAIEAPTAVQAMQLPETPPF